MSTQIQRRRGTTAEHSTFTGVEGELTIDTTKDTAVVHDGTTVGGHPLQKQYPALGSASTPTYTFTGDTNTGIYSPGADQLAISTNGTARLNIDANGNLLAGTSALGISGKQLTLKSGQGYVGLAASATESTIFSSWDSAATPLLFTLGGSERLRITAAGLVGVGTSTPGARTEIRQDGSSAVELVRLVNDDTSGAGSRIKFRNYYDSALISSTSTPGLSFGGSLRLQTYNDTNTLNTGLVMDNQGRVGVGTTSPIRKFVVSNSGAEGLETGPGESANLNLQLHYNRSSSTYVTNKIDAADHLFFTSATERARIDSSGRVGIGTSSPQGLMHLYGTNPLMSIQGDGGSYYSQFDISGVNGKLFLTTYYGPTLTAANSAGTAPLVFRVGATTASGAYAGIEAARFDSQGRLAIGTSAPGGIFHTFTTGLDNVNFFERASGSKFGIYNSGTDSYVGTFSNTPFRFATNDVERARLTTSGQLLVGTSSSRSVYSGNYASQLQIEGTGASAGRGSLSVINNAAGSHPTIISLGKSNTNSIGGTTLVANGEWLGNISFQGTDGTNMVPAAYIDCYVDGTPGANDMPGRIVLSTTADGASSPTERMRISNSGASAIISSGNVFAAEYTGGAGTDVRTLYAGHSSTGYGTRTISFQVWSNGNVQNTNNSYGSISDIKLKENIVDANSQWNDVKAFRVRNYNLKSETNQQTHTQIGLIAQEAEIVSPGLVYESPDRDEDGNDLGTVTKSVNYSVLYMKAVKALQEAMERIEQLETEMAEVKAQLS